MAIDRVTYEAYIITKDDCDEYFEDENLDDLMDFIYKYVIYDDMDKKFTDRIIIKRVEYERWYDTEYDEWFLAPVSEREVVIINSL